MMHIAHINSQVTHQSTLNLRGQVAAFSFSAEKSSNESARKNALVCGVAVLECGGERREFFTLITYKRFILLCPTLAREFIFSF